jgi:PleD family two-component response regulator
VASLITYSNIAIPLIALGLVTFHFRLASVRAEARMELMALTDSLTGLYHRRQMEALLEEAKARLAERAGLSRKVTLTLGLASYRRGTEIGALIKSADEALYAGKSGGRNRVVIDESIASAAIVSRPQSLRVS